MFGSIEGKRKILTEDRERRRGEGRYFA